MWVTSAKESRAAFPRASACTGELAGNGNEHAVNEATRNREPEDKAGEKQQRLANAGHPREQMHWGREGKWVMERDGAPREPEADRKRPTSGNVGP